MKTFAKTGALIVILTLSPGLNAPMMAQTVEIEGAELDLEQLEATDALGGDAGDMGEAGESGDFLLLDEEEGTLGGDPTVDPGADSGVGGDDGEFVLEDDTLDLDAGELSGAEPAAGVPMELDQAGSGDRFELVEEDQPTPDLALDAPDLADEDAGDRAGDELDDELADDLGAAEVEDLVLEGEVEDGADLADDLAADLPGELDTDSGAVDVGVDDSTGEFMVLDEAGTASAEAGGEADLGLAPGAEDELADLDAQMAGMMGDALGGDESAAVAADDAGGQVAGAAAASGEMAQLDAELADMIGGGSAEQQPEQGSLVLDDGQTDADGAGGDGVLLADDADLDEGEGQGDQGLSVYAVLKNESAVFVRSGTVTGAQTSTLGGGSHDAGKLFKSEFSLNVYANAQITPDALVHTQLNLSYDPKAEPDWYRKPRANTQFEVLRELYLDTRLPLVDDQGVSMRLGKQQVVWGTADGIKLLDIINPTDYREFVQNTFEDSRIPVWMLNLERNVGDNGNIQLIAAQNQRNRIPGLDKDGDSGQPFIMKGVDSITGSVNGFLNIAPAMGKVADAFNRLSALSGSPVGLTPLSFVTVNDFATNNPVAQRIFGGACSPTFNPATPTSAACLKDISERPDQTLAGGGVLPGGDNQFVTNLIDATTQGEWDLDNPNSAFEYMAHATFATFNTFVSAKSRYTRKNPDELSPNLGGRWKSSIGSNFNYSLNYFYSYDSNPSVSMSWQNDQGETLRVKKVRAKDYVDAGILPGVPAGTENLQTVILKDSAGRSYGPYDGDPTSRGFGGPGAGAPTLVFTEERNRIHNLGASFDYALDAPMLGAFVLRGEFLYQRDVRVPMVDRNELSIGNITEGLYPDEVDYFKYVLGAETIVFTNLTVSAQFIQFVNLDYQGGSDRYHASQAVVSLTNDLKRGYKYTNFGSLFLSKPFGAQQDGRVNNIIIAERGGGYWNRLDVEYRFSDALIGTAELNMYFGDEDTMFGQFKDSSNFQVGLKYIFE